MVDVEMNSAKMQELEAWRSHNVYDLVVDEGQPTISVRWVVTPKVVDGIPSVKACLVAKGFQEQQDLRKGSPTCSHEST